MKRNSYPKKAKCKVCKSEYTKINMANTTCGIECAIEWAKKLQEKREAKKKTEARVALREFKNESKVDLKKYVQPLINEYARKRDYILNGKRCVTCGITTGKMDGGHFLPTSTHSAIRYNVNQIHQQCVKCNRYNFGMPKEYRLFMINKYSLEYVEMLEKSNEPRLYTIEYYQRLKRIVRKKIAKLNKKMLS